MALPRQEGRGHMAILQGFLMQQWGEQGGLDALFCDIVGAPGHICQLLQPFSLFSGPSRT